MAAMASTAAAGLSTWKDEGKPNFSKIDTDGSGGGLDEAELKTVLEKILQMGTQQVSGGDQTPSLSVSA